MEYPHELGQYLGCYHRLAEHKCPRTAAVVPECRWDMEAHNRDAMARYEKEAFRQGARFYVANTPFAPKQDAATFNSLIDQEGRMTQRERASHLMMLLLLITYRMASKRVVYIAFGVHDHPVERGVRPEAREADGLYG